MLIPLACPCRCPFVALNYISNQDGCCSSGSTLEEEEVAISEQRHSARFIRGKSWLVHHGGGEHGWMQQGESANPRRAILEQASPEKTEEAMQRNHWKEGGRGEERRGGCRES